MEHAPNLHIGQVHMLVVYKSFLQLRNVREYCIYGLEATFRLQCLSAGLEK